MWTMRPQTLYSFSPPTHPEFTVHYTPIGKDKQKRLRSESSASEDLYMWLEEMFSLKTVLIVEVQEDGTECHYVWPHNDYEEQEHILSHLPDLFIMEAGAHFVGAILQVDPHGYAYCLSQEDFLEPCLSA
jgi:hypothetical protein